MTEEDSKEKVGDAAKSFGHCCIDLETKGEHEGTGQEPTTKSAYEAFLKHEAEERTNKGCQYCECTGKKEGLHTKECWNDQNKIRNCDTCGIQLENRWIREGNLLYCSKDHLPVKTLPCPTPVRRYPEYHCYACGRVIETYQMCSIGGKMYCWKHKPKGRMDEFLAKAM